MAIREYKIEFETGFTSSIHSRPFHNNIKYISSVFQKDSIEADVDCNNEEIDNWRKKGK